MRFWTSKTRSEDANWSVVLNPLRSELDRNRVAQKISDLFHLSFEEARELVQNTPIILLDELTAPVASRLKDVFEEVRAEVNLTNDPLAKRRCFRAVWPETPDLSFLGQDPVAPAEALEPPGAEEIPVRENEEELPRLETVLLPPPPKIDGESEALRKQVRELEESLHGLRHKFQELEKKHRELQGLDEERTRENRQLKLSLEKELKEQTEKADARFRSTVEEWEGRYQGLREESRESKKIYEEKIFAAQKEIESMRTRMKELAPWQERAAHFEMQAKGLQDRVNLLESTKESLERSVKERSDEVTLWKEKSQTLVQKSERFESLYAEERKRREETQAAREQAGAEAERMRREAESRLAETERWQKKSRELEEKQGQFEDTIALWQDKAFGLEKQLKSLQERLNLLESTKETLERSLKERVDEVTLWKERSQALAQKSERFESLYEEERKRRDEVQLAHQQANEQIERSRREIEAQIVEAERWRKKSQELEENQKRLEKEFAEFSEEQESEIKRLREVNQELEGQLAVAQRQTRDLMARVEQQELIEKRERLNNELTIKEAKLRELVVKREHLREEAQEREIQAEGIANEQANLEREILEIKQSQRHLLEQSKLVEKNHRTKRSQPHSNLGAGEPV